MVSFMSISPVEVWFVIGMAFIILEFTQVPAIGFLFLGLGFISTAIIIHYSHVRLPYQIAYATFASVAWFIILWGPLKVIYKPKSSIIKDSFDIIGAQVIVVEQDIAPNKYGQSYVVRSSDECQIGF